MAKLSLIAAPTFVKNVGIPIAGGEPVDVMMMFKHRTRSALDEFIASRPDRTDLESFLEMVCGWGLEDEFTPENAATLLENRIGTALATYRVYIDELVKAKEKN